MSIPVAKIIPHKFNIHNHCIEDNYAWLRDTNWPKVEDPKILEYLQEENQYYKNYEDKIFEEKIYKELRDRVIENDESYPIKKGGYYYFTKVISNLDYPIYKRRKAEIEENILDCNELSIGKTSFSMGDISISEDHSFIAYSYDCDGSERFKIEVKNLKENLTLEDQIENTIDSIIWNKSSTGFYYILLDENWRRNRVFFHKLGTNQTGDQLIYFEKDQIFSISISESADHEYLFINTGCSTSNEIYYLSLAEKAVNLNLVIKRKTNLLYEVDYLKENFYILTNDLGKNFRLISSKKIDNFDPQKFKEIVPVSDEYYLVDFSCYYNGIVVTKKTLGMNKFEIYSLRTNIFLHEIELKEDIYQASNIFTTPQDDFVRISYSSLVTPRSIIEFDFLLKELYVRKLDDIPGYEPDLYRSERIWVETQDGAKIPVSLVYKRNQKKKNMPMLLYGYGSYGYAIPTNFRPNIISLLDRGIAYAIAHIRGGDELGFKWYESAKFLTKKRTFEDFISVAEYFIEHQYTNCDRLSIMGGSAGGMLMGAVINMRPELFRSVVALVPFVDVLNTMLDNTLPLTPGEFEEWGNPIENEEYFNYIKSYSPYDNIKPKAYPQILVTAGLTDPRVGYWEAAKWVAKLRALKRDSNLLVLKTEMDSGHKGQSGRYKSLEETAMIYSFLLRTLNITS